jgi:Kef-type K+ transport system membrane component KefB
VSTVAADVIGDIALVIVISALLSSVARRRGQPAVIGQILTGLMPGPSSALAAPTGLGIAVMLLGARGLPRHSACGLCSAASWRA